MRYLILVLLALALFAGDARSDVDVIRRGEENPMLTVAKSTFWGAMTGLVLGGAIALVAQDNEEDILRWSIAAGTFVGFAVGIYHVATRPSATNSLIQMGGNGVSLGVPNLELDWRAEKGQTSARLSVFSYGF
jgi:hypothetical protein